MRLFSIVRLTTYLLEKINPTPPSRIVSLLKEHVLKFMKDTRRSPSLKVVYYGFY